MKSKIILIACFLLNLVMFIIEPSIIRGLALATTSALCFGSFWVALHSFNLQRELAIRLEDEDFRALVAGKEIFKKEGAGVRMILADIGFDRMAMHLAYAMDGEAIE